jgi:hypothetical protein
MPANKPIIACLVGGSKATTERYFGGFSQGMRESGYTQGRDYGFEVRYAEGDYAHGPLLAEELMNLRALVRLEAQRRGESIQKYPGTVVVSGNDKGGIKS